MGLLVQHFPSVCAEQCMTIVNAASVTLERVVPSTVAELQRESVWVFFLVVYPQGFKHGQTRRVALSPRTPVAVAATTTMTACRRETRTYGATGCF